MAASTSRSGEIASSSSSSSSSVPATLPSYREVKLEKENELRIEVGTEFQLNLILLAGTAEIFGKELDLQCWNIYPPRMKFAVFTWDGATIGIDGITDREYTSDKTPMRIYRHIHIKLEEKRTHAADNPDSYQGPRVIVVGPADSGKTTLSMMLLSWAANLDRVPLFVDLDVDQGSITVPGCLSAIPIHTPIDPVRGIPIDIDHPPLAYFYGHLSPSTDVELYKFLLRKLAQTIQNWIDKSTVTRAAGMIINTMGRIDGVESSAFLRYAISIFRTNVVLVLDEEKLYKTLKDALKGIPVCVLNLRKSGGVVSRNPMIRSEARNFKVREYFYGPGGNDHTPHSHTAHFSDFKIFRIGYWQPLNNEESAKVVSAVPERLSRYQHLNHILAISFATEQSNILSRSITGFIYVTAIDFTSKKFTYLTPTEIDIPRKTFIFFSPPGEEIPRGRFTRFFLTEERRRLTHSSPALEVIPNNCLIAGYVCANLEESAPPTEEEDEDEEYIPVSDVIG